MASKSEGDPEIIDLTNETLKPDTTITLDDSIAITDDDEPEADDTLVQLDDTSSNSSAIPSWLPSPGSLFSSPKSSQLPSLSPEPKASFSSQPISLSPKPKAKKSKSTAKGTSKQDREEARKLKLKQKEEEKLQKDANRANAANKALTNCVANIANTIPEIVNDSENAAINTLFDESSIKYRMSSIPDIDNSITWTYQRTEAIDGECIIRTTDSTWIMIVMTGQEYLKKILSYRDNPDDLQSIKSYLREIKSRTGKDVILLVYNFANYLKSLNAQKTKTYRKNFKDRFEGKSNPSVMPEEEYNPAPFAAVELQDLRLMLEMEFKHQNSECKLHIEFYDKTDEIVGAIAKYTISIAKLQVKQKARESTGLDWAINMDKERAVDPTKSSEDLTRLWVTQLQQFPQVTLPIAKAIAAEYPSPCSLIDQYNNLTEEEAEELLSELYVQKNLKRQIGSNISKRIHCFMTCEDPEVLIGLS